MAKDEKDNVRSISERAAEEAETGEQTEAFPMGTLPGDGVALKTLIKANHRVEITTSIRSAEVPSPTGGLFDASKEGRCIVTYEVDHYEPVPIREGDRGNKKLVGWKIRQVLRPVYIEPVENAESSAA